MRIETGIEIERDINIGVVGARTRRRTRVGYNIDVTVIGIEVAVQSATEEEEASHNP